MGEDGKEEEEMEGAFVERRGAQGRAPQQGRSSLLTEPQCPSASDTWQSSSSSQHPIFLGAVPPVPTRSAWQESPYMCAFHRDNIQEAIRIELKAGHGEWVTFPPLVTAPPPTSSHRGSFCVCRPPAQRLQRHQSVSKAARQTSFLNAVT